MRRFRHGPRFGISTEALAHTQVQQYPKKMTFLFSIDAHICSISTSEPAQFMLRIQEILSVPRRKDYFLYPESRRLHPTPAIFVCEHIYGYDLADLIDPVIKDCQTGTEAPSSSFACGWCNTNFRIEICDYYRTNRALVVTKWMNLGAGFTPDDTHWVRYQMARRRLASEI
jgi:hypothetical protein